MFEQTQQDRPRADLPAEAVVGQRIQITGRPVNAFSGIVELEFRSLDETYAVAIHRTWWDSISFVVPDKLGEHVVEGTYSNGTSVPEEVHIFGTLDIKAA